MFGPGYQALAVIEIIPLIVGVMIAAAVGTVMMAVRRRDRREHRSSPTTAVRRERSEDADEEEGPMAGIGWQELVILLFILGVFLL